MKFLPFLLILSCTMPGEVIIPDPCPHQFRFIGPILDIDIESDLDEVDLRITERGGVEHNLTVRREYYKCVSVRVDEVEVDVEVWAEGYCRTDLK